MTELLSRARRWLARPLRNQAPALLAALAGLLLLAGIATAAGALRGERERPVTRPPAPVLGRALEPQHGGEEILTDAENTAQGFLEEYLPFAYGQGPLPSTGLTAELREQLRRDYTSGAARAPARAEQDLRPRVTALELIGRNPERRLDARAAVADGSGTPYTLELTLRRSAGSWRVTELGRP